MPHADPEERRAYMKCYMRDRRSQKTNGPTGLLARTAENKHRVEWLYEKLRTQVETVESDEESTAIERARAIGYLAGPILKAIEVGGMASRLAELEDLMAKLQEDSQ